MYTLLIVDDEEIEREGMAQFIPWDSYEIKVVSTARNGAEGLEKSQNSGLTSPSWTSRCR
ncbi:MAG: hypothetical protein ACLU9R_04185 [Faecalibacterium sp.]